MTQPTIEQMIEFVDDAITWEGSPVIDKSMFIAIRAALRAKALPELDALPEWIDFTIAFDATDGTQDGAYEVCVMDFSKSTADQLCARSYVSGKTRSEALRAAIAAAKDGAS